MSLRSEMDTVDTVCGNAKPWPGWARGPGRHGGEAPAMCVGTDDVGLDSWFLLIKEKERKQVAESIDARHRPGHRRHDMVAGALVKREKSSILLRVCGKVVILQAVGRGNGMKNQWIIKT